VRILLLGDISSEHIEKWAIGMDGQGIEVGIFSLIRPAYNWHVKYERITWLNPQAETAKFHSLYSKVAYLKVIPGLKRAIRKFRPDIVHAHYATSYGMLANLSGFKPYFISAWGTDVMKFPEQGFWNAAILRNNLNRAAEVCATSNTIKEFISKVSSREVHVIPFGVDLDTFKPFPVTTAVEAGTIVISCIKSLEKIYCIDVLLEAFALLKKRCNAKMVLQVVGPGSERKNLEKQAKDLGISESVIFTGRVDFASVPEYFNASDIIVNISEYESFGVSVIEAMACEKPVVVTSVGGLKEIVEENVNGFLVPVKDAEATAEAMEKLVKDSELRKTFGKQGRKKVEREYKWEDNLAQMISLYKKHCRAS
jgi:glycosyltransferase involved in cell wall biosynthesis